MKNIFKLFLLFVLLGTNGYSTSPIATMTFGTTQPITSTSATSVSDTYFTYTIAVSTANSTVTISSIARRVSGNDLVSLIIPGRVAIGGNNYNVALSNGGTSSTHTFTFNSTGYTQVELYFQKSTYNGTDYDVKTPANCAYMFYNNIGISSIDLSGLDTSSATDMSRMFYGCTGLTSMDISPLNTSNANSNNGLQSMFYGCTNLASVNLTGLDLSAVKNISYMFYNCSSLPSVDFSVISHTNESAVTSMNMSSMFKGCTSIESINLSGFDARAATTLTSTSMFQNCSNLTTLNLSNFRLDSATTWTRTNIFNSCPSINLNLSGSHLALAYQLFNNEDNLYSVDLSNATFVANKATDMTSMFSGCDALFSVDLSGATAPTVANMTTMFSNCTALTNLDMSGMNASAVNSVTNMFSGCTSLENVNFSNLDLKSVTSLASLFASRVYLTTVNMSGMDARAVTTMESIFNGCTSLSSVNFSGINTSALTDLTMAFHNCTGLENIYLDINVAGVTKMTNMFDRCSTLSSVTFSNRFDVGALVWANYMFKGCAALTTLDLSSWNAPALRYTQYMFGKDADSATAAESGLKTLIVSPNFYSYSGASEKVYTGMFRTCSDLKIYSTGDRTSRFTAFSSNLIPLVKDEEGKNGANIDISSGSGAQLSLDTPPGYATEIPEIHIYSPYYLALNRATVAGGNIYVHPGAFLKGTGSLELGDNKIIRYVEFGIAGAGSDTTDVRAKAPTSFSAASAYVLSSSSRGHIFKELDIKKNGTSYQNSTNGAALATNNVIENRIVPYAKRLIADVSGGSKLTGSEIAYLASNSVAAQNSPSSHDPEEGLEYPNKTEYPMPALSLSGVKTYLDPTHLEVQNASVVTNLIGGGTEVTNYTSTPLCTVGNVTLSGDNSAFESGLYVGVPSTDVSTYRTSIGEGSSYDCSSTVTVSTPNAVGNSVITVEDGSTLQLGTTGTTSTFTINEDCNVLAGGSFDAKGKVVTDSGATVTFG